MKCPRDGSPLVSVQTAGLDLDKCHICDGLWLDHGELDRLRAAKVSAVEEELESRYGNPKVEENSPTGYMRCPRCADARLIRYTSTYVNPVALDRCERCHGVWVDDGELDAVLGEGKSLEEATVGPLKALLRSLGNLRGKR